MTKKIITVEPSHDRLRTVLRRPTDGGTPALPPPVEPDPHRDPETGRYRHGNQDYRRRMTKAQARDGIAMLGASGCAPWLRPHVEAGAEYAALLLARFPDPALASLVADTAAAHVTYRALHALGAAGDAKALAEARSWLREHRACIRELAALAGLKSEDPTEPPKDPLAKWRKPKESTP